MALPANQSSEFDQQRTTLNKIIAVMGQTHGLDVSVFNEAFLEKTVEKRRQAIACRTSAAYLKRLSADGAEAEAFYRSLRVVFSEFFRNPLSFALLEQQILPGLVEEKARNGHGEIRVWSAGCATGQEVWSVAILLDEIVKASKRPVPARIFATDLSEADLAIARLGVYDTKAVGNIRMRHLAGCFSRHGDSYAIAPRLRENVDFSAHNLLDGETTSPPVSIYGDFDLVFCSNVLIYYQSDAQYFILDKLWRCLAPGGHLITGETEKQIVAGTAGFHTVAPPAAIFQKKGR